MAHAGMLRWSASETDRRLDLGIVVDGDGDGDLPGGRALVRVGRAALGTRADASAAVDLAEEIGASAAVKAVSVAGAFEILNRIVDATGLPVGARRRERMRPIIELLGLAVFPHARHT